MGVVSTPSRRGRLGEEFDAPSKRVLLLACIDLSIAEDDLVTVVGSSGCGNEE